MPPHPTPHAHCKIPVLEVYTVSSLVGKGVFSSMKDRSRRREWTAMTGKGNERGRRREKTDRSAGTRRVSFPGVILLLLPGCAGAG